MSKSRLSLLSMLAAVAFFVAAMADPEKQAVFISVGVIFLAVSAGHAVKKDKR